MASVLDQLDTLLAERKQAGQADSSYVAQLHAKGLNKILEKLGEECTEAIIAAKDAEKSGENHAMVYEMADLWFHSLVALSHMGENANSVLTELSRRFNMSGLEEKASRTKQDET